MQPRFSQTWDLDVIFPGGSRSQSFADFLEGLASDISAFGEQVRQMRVPGNENDAEALVPCLQLLQQIALKLREADSFVACLAAENQHDQQAVRLGSRIKSLYADYTSALTLFDHTLTLIAAPVWSAILHKPAFEPVAYPLSERRALAKEKMSPPLESLAGDLSVDGYHAWGDLYNLAVSHIRIPFEQDGQVTELSAGQAANKLHHPDRAVRQRLFRQWEEAWAGQADFCAEALNRLAGFRLRLYKHRGWTSILKEPLAVNRMSPETLEVMWDVIERNKPLFVAYLQRKAQLLGVEGLSWADVEAPLGQATKEYGYEEGAALILEQFRRFSPKMADFAETAFRQRWIEAEDRPGKRPGGFCTSFPLSRATRIFMTYAGTASNVSTLAHELGHAYHQHVMDDLPALAQDYAMNVAETASTFAEMIVSDAALQQAGSDNERLALLEDKIQRSVAFYMNIHARFLFETSFYEERKNGLLSVERLNELMVEAQKRGYRDALSEYHPHFWASKLHFYITEVPFYNFPYTFGYLFSAGIYAIARQEGRSFEDRYVALLRDTGRMTAEKLAHKHLGVDLTKPEFWQQAMEGSIADVNRFLQLTATA